MSVSIICCLKMNLFVYRFVKCLVFGGDAFFKVTKQTIQ